MLERTTQPQTLIEKLNDHKETITVLRGTEKQGSHEFTFLGHHLLGFQTAINIVKRHQAESGWVAYEDERKPKDKSRVLAFDGRREFIALYDKGFYIVANGEYYGGVTHWMELPLPPHDSKGGAYERDLYQIEKEKGKFFEPSEVQDD